MEYDLQIIRALDWSTASKAFWNETKKKVYQFSQTVNPELREILLFLLTAKTQDEINIWKIRLVKYHEKLKAKAENIISSGIKNIYRIAENEDQKKEEVVREGLLGKL